MNRLKALNHTFISSHLKDALNTASEYALTSVTAPMGYGKSTAINWFLDQVSVKNNCQVFRVNIYSNSTGLFWRGFQASLEAADPEIQKFKNVTGILDVKYPDAKYRKCQKGKGLCLAEMEKFQKDRSEES